MQHIGAAVPDVVAGVAGVSDVVAVVAEAVAVVQQVSPRAGAGARRARSRPVDRSAGCACSVRDSRTACFTTICWVLVRIEMVWSAFQSCALHIIQQVSP